MGEIHSKEAITPLIKLHAVDKRYGEGKQRVHALKQINLAIERHDFVAIMGPSGSGKSTLLNIIGCLDSPRGGQYLLNGVDVACASPDRQAEIRNANFGYVFQDFNLLRRLTALENVELPLLYRGVPKEERRRRAISVLSTMKLQHRLDNYPAQLSGGEQQRVAIARALVGRPKVVLADEPTGALDSRTGELVMHMLSRLVKLGVTLILVTHDPSVAKYSRRLIRMRDGEIILDSRISTVRDRA